MWTSRALAVAVCLLVVLVASASRSERQPQAPVDRWEYGELQYDNYFFKATPGAPAPKVVKARWFSAAGLVQGVDWEDLASSLKAPEANAPEGKRDDTATHHRVRVLNSIGSQGWEMVTRNPPPEIQGTYYWTFKRKVTK